jgi:predicted ArsR family transcriptional regulator
MFDGPPAKRHRNAAGSEASALNEAGQHASGKIAERRALFMSWLEAAGPLGMTWKEIAEKAELDQGQVTSILSNLHEEGLITRIQSTAGIRNGRSLYVMPQHVVGRPTVKYRRNATGNTEAQRPRMTADERKLVDSVADRIRDTPQDTPITFRRSTASSLINLIRRLDD